MNIITIPYGSHSYYIRPDTSWNKDRNDYFCPDNIEELVAVPFIYARMDRAAKAVAVKFAPRYYTITGYGIRLIAPAMIIPGKPESWWLANSLDMSTYMSEGVEKSKADEVIEIIKNYAHCNEYLSADLLTEKINTSIESVSKYTSLKTGDYIINDLLPDNSLILKKGRNESITLGEIEFKIIW